MAAPCTHHCATAADSPSEPLAGGSASKGRALGEKMVRLRSHLADPFAFNAYALILNTGLTGVLGVGYWWLAAKYYSAADVGRGSALISVMTLLSGAVAINLTGTLSRFIPQAGRRTRRLVGGCYLLSSVVVVVLSGGFLLTLGRWGPSFDLLREPVIALCFVAAVVVAGIFTLQDGVLTGLRSSIWVPVENTCFGVTKIALLVLMASTFPKEGLYLSWVLAMALLVPPINGLIFARLLPRHGRISGDDVVTPTRAQIGGFFAGDYIGALFVFGAGYLVPVMVAADLKPEKFAHFYLAWTVVGILNLIATNLATSLTVEGVYEAGKLAANCRAALRRALAILLVAIAGVALVAGWGLSLLGPGYLAALPMLQALAFAALPRAVVEIWIGVLRAQGLSRQVARVQILTGVLVVGSVLLWLQMDPDALGWDLDRTTGVGLAVLASYTAVAVVVAPGLRRFLVQPSDAPGARPPAAQRRAPRLGGLSRPTLGVCLLTAAALIGYLLPLRHVHLDQINGLGLISVLPVISLMALALLALAFAITLSFRRPQPIILGAQLVATVGCLHGVAALIEPLPRFPTAWVHAGLVEFIGRAGTVMPDVDARFNWPGFFALISLLTGKDDSAGLVGLMTWTPLVSNLLYLLPMSMLLRNLRASWQAKWFAAWLFCVLNWVGQDYFSPQGFSYFFYLLFIAVLVTWFRGSGPDPVVIRSKPSQEGDKTRMLVPGELSAQPAQPGVRVSLILLLVGMFVVATCSHQLTPFVMLAAATGLVLVRRCNATGLPLLLGVILAGYVSYLAQPYWSGHLGSLIDGLGDLIGNLLAGTRGRASGGSAGHEAVLSVRLAISVGASILAVVGLLRRRRRGVDDRVILVLLLAPLPAALESYGGEIVLRVYLFVLPAVCVLAAYAFFPANRLAPRSLRAHLGAGVCALALLSGFLFARYGNEAYEITRPSELAAVEYLYQHGGSPTVLFLTDTDHAGATPFIPLGYRDVDRVQQTSMRAPSDPKDVDTVVEALRKLGPDGYLLTTRSQENYLQSAASYSTGWGDDFRSRMRKVPQARVVFRNADSVVYALTGTKEVGTGLRLGNATGVRVGHTPWTGIGILFLVLLLAVLLAREVLRTRLGSEGHGRLFALTFGAVPLLFVFVTVLIERLVLLTNPASPGRMEDPFCDLITVANLQEIKDRDGIMDWNTDPERPPSGWC